MKILEYNLDHILMVSYKTTNIKLICKFRTKYVKFMKYKKKRFKNGQL